MNGFTVSALPTLVVALCCLSAAAAFARPRLEKPELKSQPPGIKLGKGPLSVRVTTNAERFLSRFDGYVVGYNGLASLRHSGQKKNIFAHAGLNCECASVRPPTGALEGKWNAPRLVPMTIEKVGRYSVRLTEKGADAAGVNVETTFTLGETCVDMTCTVWADGDVRQIGTFWASYMNQVQNTSLYLRASLEAAPSLKKGAPAWLEMTGASHGEPNVYRPFDPEGKDWYDYLTDNPVRRHALKGSPGVEAAKAAQREAGFEQGRITPGSFGGFFYGFIDDYLFLMIFRPSDDVTFNPWMSPVGGGAIRNPAWDFGATVRRPLKAGEKVTFRVRLVYKPFAGLDDLLREVDAFQKARAGD